MDVRRIAAFSDGRSGGNPAGVVISDEMPDPIKMQKLAAEIGYSETVFSFKNAKGKWRTRYFSPETEVPFCGHATIALGAALAEIHGEGRFELVLNHADISVDGYSARGQFSASLYSPPTKSKELTNTQISPILDLFGLSRSQLDSRILPARIHAGADHFVLCLRDRHDLKRMTYDLGEGREFMRKNDIITIMLVHIKEDQLFDVRNAFASGGVLEDPATGAAAAAFSGYLRDIDWPHENRIKIIQGEDMKQRSVLKAEFSDEAGSAIKVSGSTRKL
ncbi:MAG: PhzF family phenazine biosynthesis protein [Rhizobiaceae bacterium]|nr:PhzF family phenazine biosynthesis protein [Rhizobiaceae bacterium]